MGAPRSIPPANATVRKAVGLTAAWIGHVELSRELLADVPHAADELITWSVAWEQRGQSAAAANSLRVVLELNPHNDAIRQRLEQLLSRG